MGRPRKTKAKAAAEASSSSPAFSIGNCKVEIHGSGLRCASTEQNLTISGTKGAKIVIAVDGARSSSDEIGDGSDFILLNPNDTDSRNKSLLQEVLRLYKNELPAMDYAADTGRKSGFLEKCIMGGKYKTLTLRSTSLAGLEEIIAAVSYQIVPADTQYAEIPLTAVTSAFQRVGFGHLLYKELSQRLQNVGVTTIFCWADKDSEGFWFKENRQQIEMKKHRRNYMFCFEACNDPQIQARGHEPLQTQTKAQIGSGFKQGFVSVGEVDTKGKIRKIPVRADIKRALCFPGSSTLMVAHLKKVLPLVPKNPLGEQQTSQLRPVVPDSMSPGDTDTAVPSCENLFPQTSGCNKVSKTANMIRNEASAASEGCSLSDQQPKKRTYESSSSSLKSKRVRCTAHAGHKQDMGRSDTCDKSLSVNNTPCTPTTEVHVDNSVSGDAKATICSSGRPSVMLMNIADETKKIRLTEVVEMLGGFVTCEGSSCTHVVTGKARRTMNFCIALSSGAWIVSPNWLKQSFKQGKFVGEAEHVLDDEEYKMEYKSEIRDAVMRAKERPRLLFSGYTFCLTKYIQPSPGVLSPVIKSSGGKIINKLGDSDELSEDLNDLSKTIFLACEEGMELAMDAAKRGMKTFSTDWLMTCVMKQELDLEAPQFAESL